MSNAVFSEGLTPQKVSDTQIIYSIPIYQRLFEWDEPRIIQLLNDLYHSFKKSSTHHYYIGMLTSNKDNNLIDGQQRFTVMMLLGLVLKDCYPSWSYFLLSDNKPRLEFKARTDDNLYIASKCNLTPLKYENLYMERGIKCIKDFMWDINEDERNVFSKYVFEHMTFFISFLPEEYSPKALNKYFETMNSTGKNLENHEILKVKMLRDAKLFDKEKLTRLWNAVSDMDKHLVRRRDKNERQNDIIERYNNAYNCLCNNDLGRLFASSYVNDFLDCKCEEGISNISIGNIEADGNKPVRQRLSRKNGFHSILSFSEFLLQVLWLNLDKEAQKEVGVNNFFDVNKLQETFLLYWDRIDPDGFVLSLFKYRLLYDKYVINVSNESSTYNLELSNDSSDLRGNTYQEILIKYQSMLYVNSSSSSYYLWLPSLLEFVKNNDKTCKDIYINIVEEDKKRHPKSYIEDVKNLSYKNVDRYWFWKLDFYIWQNRKELFKDDNVCSVAENYTFRRNRSIEHIAPQTPEEDSTLRLSTEIENCFGNLVLISSVQNSSLQRSPFEMKKAKALSYINKELVGSIESLKMLMIYQYDAWNEESINNHLKECIEYLNSSFDEN